MNIFPKREKIGTIYKRVQKGIENMYSLPLTEEEKKFGYPDDVARTLERTRRIRARELEYNPFEFYDDTNSCISLYSPFLDDSKLRKEILTAWLPLKLFMVALSYGRMTIGAVSGRGSQNTEVFIQEALARTTLDISKEIRSEL